MINRIAVLCIVAMFAMGCTMGMSGRQMANFITPDEATFGGIHTIDTDSNGGGSFNGGIPVRNDTVDDSLTWGLTWYLPHWSNGDTGASGRPHIDK